MQCRPLRVYTDKLSKMYAVYCDGLASVMMITKNRERTLRDMNDEEIQLDKYDGKRICSSHAWQISRGEIGSLSVHGERSASKNGIASLVGTSERKKAMWLRERIFGQNSVVQGNVVFCHEMYQYYVDQCTRIGKKPKGEKNILQRIADALSVFKIFIKNGKELGRGNSFFFNENRLIVAAGLEELNRMGREKITITKVCEEDNMIRVLAEKPGIPKKI